MAEPVESDRLLPEIIQVRDADACTRWLENSHGLNTVRVLARLSDEEREILLALLDPEDAAEVLEALPESQALEALESLEPSTAARIIEELPSDEQADLIQEIPAQEAEAILDQLDREEADSVRRLAAYDDDQAGGLMITEFLSYDASWTVRQVLDDLGENADEYADYDIQYAYVVDTENRLQGVLPLRDTLLSSRGRKLEKIMVPVTAHVGHRMETNEVAAVFRAYPYAGLPVLDDESRLVGVVRRKAVQHALVEEADETYRASQGIIGGEELRSMSIWVRSRRRLAWLSTNVLLNVLAACVIAAHQDTLEAVIALAVFLPIISDMSGCSGNQAVAVSMREMSLGILLPRDAFQVIRQELGLGLINGLVLGALVGGAAWAWKGNPYLGLVVGGALTANTLLAVCLGGTVPLLLRRLGVDPALASSPILTTITDMCGFLLVLGSASLALAHLV